MLVLLPEAIASRGLYYSAIEPVLTISPSTIARPNARRRATVRLHALSCLSLLPNAIGLRWRYTISFRTSLYSEAYGLYPLIASGRPPLSTIKLSARLRISIKSTLRGLASGGILYTSSSLAGLTLSVGNSLKVVDDEAFNTFAAVYDYCLRMYARAHANDYYEDLPPPRNTSVGIPTYSPRGVTIGSILRRPTKTRVEIVISPIVLSTVLTRSRELSSTSLPLSLGRWRRRHGQVLYDLRPLPTLSYFARAAPTGVAANAINSVTLYSLLRLPGLLLVAAGNREAVIYGRHAQYPTRAPGAQCLRSL
ncbi:hypothetical protein TPAR_07440 [Tolypocladium paradoxum]|uniref:Uncharacterized protein n=1 Tax=Tolypocladium paradoxum TaxID=94208 RepID=A0A2S4KQA0_9HYPO|nr:hypothetical protein TPAR_07440 [Tolypocladium paradoxum]